MPRQSKRYRAASEAIDRGKLYSVQDALDRLDLGALDGLIETLGVEIDERLEAGEERFAEIIDEVLEFAVEALERAIDDDIEWDEGAPSA